MKFIALVPARSGSQSIKNKNMKNFNGKPLIYWTIREALKAKKISEIIISTDSGKILNYCKKKFKRISLIKRDKNLALSNTPMHKVIKDVYKKIKLDKKEFDGFVLLQPTSPLRLALDIDKACQIFEKNNPDSLISVTKLNHKFNPESLFKKKKLILKKISNKKNPSIRQKKKTYFSNNGAAIYITKKQNIKKYIIGGRILGYEMPDHRSIDIDTDFDFKIAELIKRNGIC